MSSNRVLTGLLTFAGGFLSGLLFAPQSGAETRDQLAERAKSQMEGMEDRLQHLEARLASLGEQIKAESGQWSDKVKKGSDKLRRAAADSVLPDVPDDPAAFKVEGGEVAADLRHLPRK